jgi:hypothetical protein
MRWPPSFPIDVARARDRAPYDLRCGR